MTPTTRDFTPRTVAALQRHAARLGGRLARAEDDSWIGVTSDGERVATAHRDDDGRWVVAEWSERAHQWTGDSPDGARAGGIGYRCTVSRSLRGLRRLGVPSYATPVAALRDIEAPRHARATERDEILAFIRRIMVGG